MKKIPKKKLHPKTPSISLYRYGSTRKKGEGLRLGITRHVPRGIRREDRRVLGYFDVWIPLLAPSSKLLTAYRAGEITFSIFSRRYRFEMSGRHNRQMIQLLATIAPSFPIALGCFCEDENTCHRSLLKNLIDEVFQENGSIEPNSGEIERFSSPICYAQWGKLG